MDVTRAKERRAGLILIKKEASVSAIGRLLDILSEKLQTVWNDNSLLEHGSYRAS